MNWLAHLRLAPPVPLVRLGNLAGDFVRGVATSGLHPELLRGIAQHRAVDRFVDAHPVVRGARARLDGELGRFAGVALDVFWDHFLARDWHRHGDGRPLAAFAAEVHGELRAHDALLPPPLRALTAGLVEHRWLSGYASVDGIDRVLRAMARRRPRAAALVGGSTELQRHYDALGADFAALWPELTTFAAAAADGPAG